MWSAYDVYTNWMHPTGFEFDTLEYGADAVWNVRRKHGNGGDKVPLIVGEGVGERDERYASGMGWDATRGRLPDNVP